MTRLYGVTDSLGCCEWMGTKTTTDPDEYMNTYIVRLYGRLECAPSVVRLLSVTIYIHHSAE